MTRWRIVISEAELERCRRDAAFAHILTLGRIANMLRTALSLAADVNDRDGALASRARYSTSLLLAGLLAEALPVLKRSGKHFRHLEAHATRVRTLLQDPELESLHREWLGPMRNKAVFHNDDVVSSSGLALPQLVGPRTLVWGDTEHFMDAHYMMSDEVALLFLVADSHSGASPLAFLERSLKGGLAMTLRVIQAIDALVGQALVEMGFAMERDQPAHVPR